MNIPPSSSKALADTLFWLCDTPSPIGEEAALCDAVLARIQARRASYAGDARRYGNSLVVPVTRGRGPKIALVGHLDTVRTDNGPARVEGDRIFGAGAADMKSGLAAMLVLVEEGLDRIACDLTLVFYAREEGPFAENELGPVLEQDPELRHVDLAVCLEPSDNRLHLGCCGSIHATVTFEGKTAHSARPWEGVSAVSKAASFLQDLADTKPREHRIDGLLYRTVTTVTQAATKSRGRNVVPDSFVLNVNHRFAPDTSIEEAQAELLARVGESAKVEFTDLSPGASPSASHPLVQSLIAAGITVIDPKQAWTDVARFSALGIAAVNFGPGENAQAHQAGESTGLRLIDEGYAILSKWLSAP